MTIITATETYTIHSLDGHIPAIEVHLLTDGVTSNWSDLLAMPITDSADNPVGYVDPATGEIWHRRPVGQARANAVLLAPLPHQEPGNTD